ncbi:hypothetical protein [Paenibacillus sp. 1P07SE]
MAIVSCLAGLLRWVMTIESGSGALQTAGAAGRIQQEEDAVG